MFKKYSNSLHEMISDFRFYKWYAATTFGVFILCFKLLQVALYMYRAAVHHVGDCGFKLFQVLCSDFCNALFGVSVYI